MQLQAIRLRPAIAGPQPPRGFEERITPVSHSAGSALPRRNRFYLVSSDGRPAENSRKVVFDGFFTPGF